MAKLTESPKGSFWAQEGTLIDFWRLLGFLANTEVGGCARTEEDAIVREGAVVLGGFVDEHPTVKASKATAAPAR